MAWTEGGIASWKTFLVLSRALADRATIGYLSTTRFRLRLVGQSSPRRLLTCKRLVALIRSSALEPDLPENFRKAFLLTLPHSTV